MRFEEGLVGWGRHWFRESDTLTNPARAYPSPQILEPEQLAREESGAHRGWAAGGQSGFGWQGECSSHGDQNRQQTPPKTQGRWRERTRDLWWQWELVARAGVPWVGFETVRSVKGVAEDGSRCARHDHQYLAAESIASDTSPAPDRYVAQLSGEEKTYFSEIKSVAQSLIQGSTQHAIPLGPQGCDWRLSFSAGGRGGGWGPGEGKGGGWLCGEAYEARNTQFLEFGS